jgi:hypothetical protein
MNVPIGVPCEERRRLLDEYNEAARALSVAVQALAEPTGVASRDEYERVLRALLEAGVKSEQARMALEKHHEEHGCEVWGTLTLMINI